MFADWNFWIKQPPTSLDRGDMLLIYIFAGLFLAGIVLWIFARFQKHLVNRKITSRLSHLTLSIGLTGAFWLAFRYENTPVFSLRFWAGLAFLIGIIWLAFILKFVLFDWRSEKREFEKEQIKSKYLPQK